MDWQPIETAPKDGTRILLLIPSWRASAQTGRWLDVKRIEYGKVASELAEWSVDGHVGSIFDAKELEPTHWMPLPDPPKVSVKSDMEVA